MKGNMQKLVLVLGAALVTVALVSVGSAVAKEPDADNDGVDDAIDLCPHTVIPEANYHLAGLQAGHFALLDNDTPFDSVPPTQTNLTIADTAGCSCEQIFLLRKKALLKGGCSLEFLRDFLASRQPKPRSIAFPGDGVDGPALLYVDHGNGTITDLNTGLMWEKKDNSGGIHDVAQKFSWSAPDLAADCKTQDDTPLTFMGFPDGTAFTVFLDTLNNRCDGDETTSCTSNAECMGNGLCGHAGFRDWRLPNIRELVSIVDYGPIICPDIDPTPCPAIDPIFGSTNTEDIYWSSTSVKSNPCRAWGVSSKPALLPNDASVTVSDKIRAKVVRAVRGGR